MMKIKILSVMLLLIFSSSTFADSIKCPSPPFESLPAGWVWYKQSPEIKNYKTILIFALKNAQSTSYRIVCVNENSKGVEKVIDVPDKHWGVPSYCKVNGKELMPGPEARCVANDPNDNIINSCALVCPSSK